MGRRLLSDLCLLGWLTVTSPLAAPRGLWQSLPALPTPAHSNCSELWSRYVCSCPPITPPNDFPSSLYSFDPQFQKKKQPFSYLVSFTHRSDSAIPILSIRAARVARGKQPNCQSRRHEFYPWVGKTPWRREWQLTPVFLPRKSREQGSLEGSSPRCLKQLDTTEWLKNKIFSITVVTTSDFFPLLPLHFLSLPITLSPQSHFLSL